MADDTDAADAQLALPGARSAGSLQLFCIELCNESPFCSGDGRRRFTMQFDSGSSLYGSGQAYRSTLFSPYYVSLATPPPIRGYRWCCRIRNGYRPGSRLCPARRRGASRAIITAVTASQATAARFVTLSRALLPDRMQRHIHPKPIGKKAMRLAQNTAWSMGPTPRASAKRPIHTPLPNNKLDCQMASPKRGAISHLS